MLYLKPSFYLSIFTQLPSKKPIDWVGRAKFIRLGGDFNTRHDMFEPGVQSAHQGGELARWSSGSGMDFISTPGEPTQRSGHVLDLTFSNIPFAQSTVRPDMHSGSDHETLTIIPDRGTVHRLTEDLSNQASIAGESPTTHIEVNLVRSRSERVDAAEFAIEVLVNASLGQMNG